MDKKSIIMGVFIVLGIVGIVLFQTNIMSRGFMAGIGYVFAVLSVIVGIAIGMIFK